MIETSAQRVAYLVAGFLRERLTEAEHTELDNWVNESDANQALFESLIQPEFLTEGRKVMEQFDTEAALARLKKRIASTVPRRHRIGLFYRVAAAVLLVAVSVSVYYFMFPSHTSSSATTAATIIQPGGNHARLTLGDGRVVNVDVYKTGLIDLQDGSEVIKAADGVLSYTDNGKASTETHLLSTPTGGQYKVVLPDGTMVWLNASSSLKYPVHFSGDQRMVELSGEGYFEVASIPLPGVAGTAVSKMPFIVQVNGMKVEVLGTHFNVNAYPDEGGIRTTLLEGSVRLTHHAESVMLKPREQGVLRQAQHDTFEVLDNADVNAAVAWKEGEFSFKDASIESIMRQAARWYAIDVVYEGKIERHFNAEVLRREPIDKLLHLLELTGGVHFRVEGKRVFVRP